MFIWLWRIFVVVFVVKVFKSKLSVVVIGVVSTIGSEVCKEFISKDGVASTVSILVLVSVVKVFISKFSIEDKTVLSTIGSEGTCFAFISNVSRRFFNPIRIS